MEVVELLKELIKRQSITPNECGIYEIIKAELADFEVIEVEENGVKNLFLYKDFSRGNSSLGMQFRTYENFQTSTDFNLVESPKISTNTKATPQFLEFASEAKQPSLPLRFCDSQNLVKNNSVRSTKNSPASWCKKSESKGAVVPPADFLLEAEKRGSPPKSEKRSFWRVGGAGRGVQPFCEKESSEIDREEGAESVRDSSVVSLPQNDNIRESAESSLDSAFFKHEREKSPQDEEFAKIHLCFAGHIDVVPAGFGWTVPPFDALVKDGVIYGRGAQDMKGGVAAFVSALQKVKNFNGILSVLLTSDEEGTGIFGTKIMLECLKKRALLPHFAVVAEPTCEKKLGDSVKIGRRGSINAVLTIHGVQGHAAYPHKCTNPLDLIAPILPQITSKDLDSGDKHFAPSKIVITDIRGGIEATNVTPSELKLMFNVRNNPLTDKDAIQNYVESLLKNAGIKKYNLSFTQSAFPFVGVESSSDSTNLLDILCNTIFKKTNITPRPNTEGGTSDARYFSAFGVEVVEFGLVNDRIHAADECVKIVDLETLHDIFVDFIADFDGAIRAKLPNLSPQDEF